MKLSNKEKKGLELVIMNVFMITIKTQNYHWNIRGKNFYSLHKMFEEMYKRRLDELDDLAEFLTMQGFTFHSDLGLIVEASLIGPIQNHGKEEDMLQDLSASYRTIIKIIQTTIQEAENNAFLVDLLTEVGRAQEKDLWFVQSHLSETSK